MKTSRNVAVLAAVIGVGALAAGCATAPQVSYKLTQGPAGPDGVVVSCQVWGPRAAARELPCAEAVPAAPATNAVPRNWAMRQLCAVGDGIGSGVSATAAWSERHPAIAGGIVALGIGIGIGSQNDWYGLTKKDDSKPTVKAEPADENVADFTQKGNNNVVRIVYRYDPKTGKVRPYRITGKQDGNGNLIDVLYEPIPEE